MIKIYTIYKHTSPDNKVYIGMTSQNPERRWGTNGCKYRENEFLTSAIKEYGWDNFSHEILYENLSKEDAALKERELIEYYKSNQREYGYNIEAGGIYIGERSKYSKEKISKSLMGERNPRYGKKFPTDPSKKLSKDSEEYKIQTERRRQAHIGQIPVNKKPVRQIDYEGNEIAVYESARDAMLKTGINNTNISKCCNKKVSSAGGFKWEFVIA